MINATAWVLVLLPQAQPAAPPQSSPSPRDLAALLEPIRARHDVPALAGAIVSEGGLAAIGACGVRERGKDAKVTVDDRFHLGSCTKAMTATLCAILVEKQQLAWDTGVADALAGKVEPIDAGWKTVQLQHLLTNRGGVPGDIDDLLWAKLRASKAKPSLQRLLLADELLAKPPEAPPGRYVYSNGGFTLAGVIAEQATKTEWEDLMRRELFTPLGMTSAGFGPPGDGKASTQPVGHDRRGKPVAWGPLADNPAGIAPAGRVHCTLGDWAKFAALHVDARNGRRRLLSEESFARLHAPAQGPGDSYAMGWGVAERAWAGGAALTHQGSNTLWFCAAWLAPEKDFAVLVCCNQGGDAAAKACDDAASALIREHTLGR